ncbi:MAG: N-acetylmuramoyl-L-alanine amidase [Candidatus Tectimicrobiota bacterium]
MHDDIKRRLLLAVVQDNLTTTPARGLAIPASPAQPLRRRRRPALPQVLGLAALLVLLPLNDRSTGIVPLWQSRLEDLPVAAPVGPLALAPVALVERAVPGPQVAVLEPGLDLPLPPVQASPPMGETGTLPEPTYQAPLPIDPALIALEVRKVVLDPGHGGKDLGTSTPTGLSEKEITLDIGLRLRPLLEQAGYEVFMTRDRDEAVPLRQRAVLANEQKGDLFVSIHVNWVERSQARGMETYYLGPTEDPTALQLTAQENRDAGYSLADFRRILDHIYLSVRRDESRRLAETLQHNMLTSLRPKNPNLLNRGVKTAPFAVLVGTDMPAILAEVACLSNAEEAQLLATPQYRQDIAQALFQGIRAYAQALNRSPKISQERKLTHE